METSRLEHKYQTNQYTIGTTNLHKFQAKAAFRQFISLYKLGVKTKDKTQMQKNLLGDFYFLYKHFYPAVKLTAKLKDVLLDKKKKSILYLHITDTFFHKKNIMNKATVLQLVSDFQKERCLQFGDWAALQALLKVSQLFLLVQAAEKNSAETYNLAKENLAFIENFSMKKLFEKHCEAEKILQQDNSYGGLDQPSKSYYCSMVTQIAKKQNRPEQEVAATALKYSEKSANNHVGDYLFAWCNFEKRNRKIGKTIYGLPLLFSLVLVCLLFENILLRLVGFVPAYFLFLEFTRTFLTPFVKQKILPKQQFTNIPENSKTILAVSTLMPQGNEVKQVAKHLEELLGSNADDNISVALLVDFFAADRKETVTDQVKTRLLEQTIEKLNRRYHNKFILAVREREFSQTQREYIGPNRKMGAIDKFIRLLNGDEEEYYAFIGDKETIRQTKYLYVLDGDSLPQFDSVKTLVAVADNPLNKPVVDKRKGCVTGGYGIFVPRIENRLESIMHSPFAKLFSGNGGVVNYNGQVKDTLFDCFGTSVFSGKGLIHIQTYYEVMCNAVKPERVVSHDMVEGALLRTALVSEVSVSDDVPQTPQAWYTRKERWTRGDWQNLTALCPKKHNPIFQREITLPKFYKWRITDNVAGSFCELFLTILLLSTLLVKTTSVFTTLLFVMACKVLPVGLRFLLDTYHTRGLQLGVTPFSKVFSTTVRDIQKAAVDFVFLPVDGYISLTAACRGLYRVFISQKNLLQWTTAAQAGKQKGVNRLAKLSLPSYAVALLFFIYGAPVMKFVGLAMVFVFPMLFILSREETKTAPKIDETLKQETVDDSYRMFLFYKDNLTKDDNYLPPDNIQFTPIYKKAHRTSPTNIGFCLLSLLTGYDFGFLSKKELTVLIEKVIDTVERLPKWKGNLFNWYDTQSLKVLGENQFVSSVDSGNFAACLIALKEGLKEINEELLLIERIEKMIEDTDLNAFYNSEKQLISIGFDYKEQKLLPNCYDLLMSEARLTSFVGVAKRQIPKEHWGNLSTICGKTGHKSGPLSWSGTMFEYFMPHILLPVYEGSLLYEGLGYALFCQRRKLGMGKLPWGVSESGYYKFDGELNYQYYAFGVQNSALKQFDRFETVVSPYSTQLTLPFDFSGGVKNLNHLKKEGVFGKYGFFEAVDYTKGKHIVKSFMAHHVGMGLVSINNAVNKNIMQKRFMRDREMNLAKGFLQEKIDSGVLFFENKLQRQAKQIRRGKRSEEKMSKQILITSPEGYLLGSDKLQFFATDSGLSFLQKEEMTILQKPKNPFLSPRGIFAAVKVGDTIICPTYAPLYDDTVRQVTQTEKEIVYQGEKNGITVQLRFSLSEEGGVLFCKTKVTGQGEKDVQILFYMQPVLNSDKAFSAHKTYYNLFVRSQYDKKSKQVVFYKRETADTKPIGMSVGFLEETEFTFDTEKEEVLTTPKGAASFVENFERELKNKTMATNPCLVLKTNLQKGESEKTLLLSVAENFKQVIEQLNFVRNSERKVATQTPLNNLEREILSAVCFYSPLTSGRKNAVLNNTLNREGLWSLGISGDRPIVLIKGGDNETRQKALLAFEKLVPQGVYFDLVILLKEQGEKQSLEKIEKPKGHFGSVFVFDRNDVDEEHLALLNALSVYTDTDKQFEEIGEPFYKKEFTPVKTFPFDYKKEQVAGGGYFSGGSFVVTSTPKVPWSNVLANESFGTLTNHNALGYTWAMNSRENKLTTFSNDTSEANRGERIILQADNEYYDLIDGAQAEFNPNFTRYLGSTPNIKTKVTVTVDSQKNAKEIAVELLNLSDTVKDIKVVYYAEPVLGESEENSYLLKTKFDENYLIATNPYHNNFTPVMGINCSEKVTAAFTSQTQFYSGDFEKTEITPGRFPCMALACDMELITHQHQGVNFKMAFGLNEQEVKSLLNGSVTPKKQVTKNTVQLRTKNQLIDVMTNTWSVWQALGGRIYGKTGFYQNGGAFGFRDQLQDMLPFILLEPAMVRKHILRACSVQFPEGDVLHWWHSFAGFEDAPRGVRTRYSDDLLWLPFVTAKYVQATHNESLLQEQVPFLQGEQLEPGQKDRYDKYYPTENTETVFEHCVLAIEKSLKFSDKGIPFIGGGDWCDGFNNMGKNGNGQSVWLGMFLIVVLEEFMKILPFAKRQDLKSRYQEIVDNLKESIDKHFYEGRWYQRAVDDTGYVYGAEKSEACQLDSLPQSFAAFAKMPINKRVKSALASVQENLVDEENMLIKLFTPPFDETSLQPGYVKDYPAGIRENGGQYTHAALWYVIALFLEGLTSRGYSTLSMLTPPVRSLNEDVNRKYLLEPFWLPADIYTSESNYGKGGWSLYTGSAAWYWVAVVNIMLGIERHGDKLLINPRVPDHFREFSITLEIENTPIFISAKPAEEIKMVVNNEVKDYIPLDQNSYNVQLYLRRRMHTNEEDTKLIDLDEG